LSPDQPRKLRRRRSSSRCAREPGSESRVGDVDQGEATHPGRWVQEINRINMKKFWIITKRIGGTLLIAGGLSGILLPLLIIFIPPSASNSIPIWNILQIILTIAFLIAGWSIMKKEEQAKAKILEKKNRQNQSSEPTPLDAG
jgi:hypothetical protein